MALPYPRGFLPRADPSLRGHPEQSELIERITSTGAARYGDTEDMRGSALRRGALSEHSANRPDPP